MIDHIIILCCWIWGVHFALRDGSLFHGIARILERTLGTTLCKPLFLCPPCMSSVHGFAYGVIIWGLEPKVFILMMCACGLNFIIKSFVYPEYVEEDIQEKE